MAQAPHPALATARARRGAGSDRGRHRVEFAANHANRPAPSASQSGSRADDAIYTVDQVRAGLLQDPSSWVGRMIRVRGVLQGPFVFCGNVNPCPPKTLGLVDDGNGIIGSDQYLPVMPGNTLSIASLQYNVPFTYGLQLHADPTACALNPSILCYQGTLTDATVGAS